jgi:hypothetical protein
MARLQTIGAIDSGCRVVLLPTTISPEIVPRFAVCKFHPLSDFGFSRADPHKYGSGCASSNITALRLEARAPCPPDRAPSGAPGSLHVSVDHKNPTLGVREGGGPCTLTLSTKSEFMDAPFVCACGSASGGAQLVANP